MNMLDINEKFQENSFDSVLSFGNTIVHLKNLNELNVFFAEIRKVLKPSSPLLFQIINYERILEQNITNLSTIDNEHISFERNYCYKKSENSVEFSTILTLKETGVKIKNNVSLYPLLSAEINDLLTANGFTDINYYGSFKKDNFVPDSLPLIVEAI
jgi:glycine/sarcosine N-methyltransferase